MTSSFQILQYLISSQIKTAVQWIVNKAKLFSAWTLNDHRRYRYYTKVIDVCCKLFTVKLPVAYFTNYNFLFDCQLFYDTHPISASQFRLGDDLAWIVGVSNCQLSVEVRFLFLVLAELEKLAAFLGVNRWGKSSSRGFEIRRDSVQTSWFF